MLERKVYDGWAYTANEEEKAQINMEIYAELCKKYKISYALPETEEEAEQYDIIVHFCRSWYASCEYEIIKEPEGITDNEIALICDRGNLCFGHCRSAANRCQIYTDQRRKNI